MILAALHRLLWFLLAAAIGLLWAYSEQITGRALSIQGHAVLAMLFTTALATAGYNLRELLAWRRELLQLSDSTSLSQAELHDAKRLLLILREQKPERIRALRQAITDEPRDGT